eukprot:359601-Chlamydomonas_euryale.AAC.1
MRERTTWDAGVMASCGHACLRMCMCMCMCTHALVQPWPDRGRPPTHTAKRVRMHAPLACADYQGHLRGAQGQRGPASGLDPSDASQGREGQPRGLPAARAAICERSAGAGRAAGEGDRAAGHPRGRARLILGPGARVGGARAVAVHRNGRRRCARDRGPRR